VTGNALGREDDLEHTGEFAPLGVGAAAAHSQGPAFQTFESFDFDAQLGNGAGGGGLIEDFFLGGFNFVVGGFVEILHVLNGIELDE